MKRLILAALPILLAAHIPFSVMKFVPSDWKKNFQNGVTWMSLLLNSYSAVTNEDPYSDPVPEGMVETTVAMAIIPELDISSVTMDHEICHAQREIARKTRDVMKIQREFNRKFRTFEVRVKTIHL